MKDYVCGRRPDKVESNRRFLLYNRRSDEILVCFCRLFAAISTMKFEAWIIPNVAEKSNQSLFRYNLLIVAKMLSQVYFCRLFAGNACHIPQSSSMMPKIEAIWLLLQASPCVPETKIQAQTCTATTNENHEWIFQTAKQKEQNRCEGRTPNLRPNPRTENCFERKIFCSSTGSHGRSWAVPR
jgi:hypothetical protein